MLRVKSAVKKDTVPDRDLISHLHEDLSNILGFTADDASLEEKAQFDYQRNLAQKAMRTASTERTLRDAKRKKDVQIIKTGLAGVGVATGAVGLASGILLATQGAALPALVGMGLMGADLIKMAAEKAADVHAPSTNPMLDRIVDSKIDDISMDISGGGYYMQSMEELVEECSQLMDEIRDKALSISKFSPRRDKGEIEQKQLLEAADELKLIITTLGPTMHENPLESIRIAEELKKIREKIRADHFPRHTYSAKELRGLLSIDWSPYTRITQDVCRDIMNDGKELDEESQKILAQALQEHTILCADASGTALKEEEEADIPGEAGEDHWVLTEDLKPMYESWAKTQRIKSFIPLGYAPEGPSLFRQHSAADSFSSRRTGLWTAPLYGILSHVMRRPADVVSGPSLFGPGSRFERYRRLPPVPMEKEERTLAKAASSPAPGGSVRSLFAQGIKSFISYPQPVIERWHDVPTHSPKR